MVATGLKSCFTCCRRTENFLCITEDDNLGEENLEEIFVKHFWFSKDEYRNGVLCSSCWAKIDEFHKFYCEVEKLHASNQLETELKSEPNDENPDGNERRRCKSTETTRSVLSSSVSNKATSDGVVSSSPGNREEEKVPNKTSSGQVQNDQPKAESALVREDLNNLHQRLDRIEGKMDAQSSMLEKLSSFIMDPNRFPPVSRDSCQATGAPSVCSAAGNRCDLKVRGDNENFAEFERMPRIYTSEELMVLDQNLQKPEYEAKFLRYFQTVYTLNGKREGGPFFKTVVRKLLAPSVLLPYSWKGITRTERGNESSSKNVSFKLSFPNFVRFMRRVVSVADFDYTDEDNEKAFSDFLRQKKTEMKRYADGHTERRAACSRKRRRGIRTAAFKNSTDELEAVGGETESEQQQATESYDGDYIYGDEFVLQDVDGDSVGEQHHQQQHSEEYYHQTVKFETE